MRGPWWPLCLPVRKYNTAYKLPVLLCLKQKFQISVFPEMMYGPEISAMSVMTGKCEKN